MESSVSEGLSCQPPQGEASTCCQLSVKILEARNLFWIDLLSEADPYVVLRLPTASATTFRTKIISNSNHPIWNETFSFRIQRQVKNILELKVYDADLVTEDKDLFTVYFDIIEVSPGKSILKTFALNPQGKEELDVEFQVEEISDSPENLITNNVLVARELSCLTAQVDKTGSMAMFTEKDELVLTLKGSYEDTQISTLGSGMVDSFLFHYITAQETEMKGCIKSLEIDGKKDIPAENLTVPLKSLTMGEEVAVTIPAADATALGLKLSTNSCSEELTVRLGFGLCDEEQAFLKKRKQVVAKALKRVLQLEHELQEDEVPVIGVMAIGGGARAMTSLYGHLFALKKLDLLDCVTYISSTSGSTWTLASLYENPDWSHQDLEKPISHAREHMAKSKLAAFSLGSIKEYQQELKKRAEEGYPTSFVDLWPLVLEFLLHGQVTEHKFSEQRAALEQGQNPLPLYLALNVKENLGTLDFKEWVEFSPYEIGFLKYGAFIPSELFGSEFFMGRLMKKLPESRICFLEGLWSNIFSGNLMDAWYDLTSSEETWKQNIRDKTKNVVPEKELPASQSTSWINLSWLQPGTALSQAFQGLLTGRLFLHQCHNFLRGLHLHQNYKTQRDFCTWGEGQLDSIPSQLTPLQPQLCLVDAAFFINTSCPLLLRAGRSPDLILSFGYSINSPFQELEQMEIYCRGRGIPFPRVELSEEERIQPRECHVFSDPDSPEAPTVLHFPLVNLSFKEHSAPGIKRSPEELAGGQVDLTGFLSPYSLTNMTYSGDDFDRLLHLNSYNVQNNHNEILMALRTALKHRKQRQP